jgi:hypothetical protein
MIGRAYVDFPLLRRVRRLKNFSATASLFWFPACAGMTQTWGVQRGMIPRSKL